jgi:hypothetical protein
MFKNFLVGKTFDFDIQIEDLCPPQRATLEIRQEMSDSIKKLIHPIKLRAYMPPHERVRRKRRGQVRKKIMRQTKIVDFHFLTPSFFRSAVRDIPKNCITNRSSNLLTLFL